MKHKITYFLIFFLITISLTGCGGFKKVDMREKGANAQERARKNVEEGKGVSINKILRGRGNTNFQFSSSNPLWRGAIEVFDFVPLTNASYSGGIIITEWFSAENNSSDNVELKITVRFMTNEIRADAIKVLVFEKKMRSN